MSMLSRFATLGGGGDPYWANVSYLLVGNGANGTTTNIKDSSSNNVTTTITGNTVISTAQSKYGSGSVYFDGAGDYLTGTSGSNFVFGTGDFTIEMWVYLLSSKPNPALFDTRDIGITNGIVVLFDAANKLWLYDGTIYASSTNSVTLNSWNYVAVSRVSGVIKTYINGTSGFSQTITTNLSGSGCLIGTVRPVPNDPTFNFNGYMYDLRITKGVGRYTGSTMPVPSAPLPTTGP